MRISKSFVGDYMYVLVACECSQTVCKAFRLLGHIAFSCDIQSSYGGFPQWHIKGDCLPLLYGFCTFKTEDGLSYTLNQHWDLIIAHPPCTFLSKAGANRLFYYLNGEKRLNLDRFLKLLEARAFFYKIIDFTPSSTLLCIENPIPLKVAELPAPSQVVEPFYYGDNTKKYTYLWLYNGLPPLLTFSTTRKPGVVPIVNASSKYGGLYNSAKLRSEFSPFIASAMANQWGCLR